MLERAPLQEDGDLTLEFMYLSDFCYERMTNLNRFLEAELFIREGMQVRWKHLFRESNRESCGFLSIPFFLVWKKGNFGNYKEKWGCSFCLCRAYPFGFQGYRPQSLFESKEQSAKAQMRLIWVWSQRPFPHKGGRYWNLDEIEIAQQAKNLSMRRETCKSNDF